MKNVIYNTLNMREAVLKDTLKTYEETLALRKTQLPSYTNLTLISME